MFYLSVAVSASIEIVEDAEEERRPTSQDEHRPVSNATLDDVDEEVSKTQYPNVAIRHYDLDHFFR